MNSSTAKFFSSFWRVVGVLAILLAIVATFYTIAANHGLLTQNRPLWPTWLFALYGVLLMWGIATGISGTWDPLSLAIGADGLMSVSKFQFLLWNGAALFAWLWLLASRIYETHKPFVAIAIPPNVLLLMGFSVITYAGARGITIAYKNIGRVSKPDSSDSSIRYLATADDGQTPDLVKIQMLTWTIIAVVVFLVQTGAVIDAAALVQGGASNHTLDYNSLPDVGQALMVLMGLGQAAYLGNKLVSSDAPVLTSAQPAIDVAGKTVGVVGDGLGGNVNTYLDSVLVANSVVPLTASSFNVNIPPAPIVFRTATGLMTLPSGYTAQLSISVDGITAANALPVRL